MARIEGVDLPRDKRIEAGLVYIYGIGPKSARDILAATKVSPDTRVRDLTEAEVTALRRFGEHANQSSVRFNINWPDDLVAAEEWLSQTTKP